ncbi:MAG: M14 family zinc carboxypeptidase, partial [Bryobacteraceae bacterium]
MGYEPGDRISTPGEIVRYLDALAASMPSRIRVFDYGKTWEGRRLIYAAIGSEKNIARLDAIKADMQKLADPRSTREGEAKKVMDALPAIVWLGYGVHGNEISSSDAALFTAYHLLAARGDKVVDSILENDLILIDPLQNPDGRNRFVENFEQSEGLRPEESPNSAGHEEPWPGGRTNHYLFDMNRDWFAMTQPETQGRIKA